MAMLDAEEQPTEEAEVPETSGGRSGPDGQDVSAAAQANDEPTGIEWNRKIGIEGGVNAVEGSEEKARKRDEGAGEISQSGQVMVDEQMSNNGRDPTRNDPDERQGVSKSKGQSPPPEPIITSTDPDAAANDGVPDPLNPPDTIDPPAESGSDESAGRPSTPRMDLGKYPTPELLKILASLLQQIAVANDALRPSPSPSLEGIDHTGQSSGGSSRVGGHGLDSRGLPSHESLGSSSRRDDMTSRHVTSRPTSQQGSPTGRKSSRGSMVDSMVIPPFRPKNGQSSTPGSSGAGRSGERSTPSRSGSGSSTDVGAAESAPKPEAGASSNTERNTVSPSKSSSRSDHPARMSIPTIPRHNPSSVPPNPSGGTQFTTTAARKSIAHPSAILCFHARNVPSISIEAYLNRILKYCPTTNEVFLSLLIYFDRMSRTHYGDVATSGVDAGVVRRSGGSVTSQTLRGFAIDSFNVHRLVIAGITVASKFFSDIFYTNSRYAKVGGLPQTELNQLELQFLLLNDFNLQIPLEELQRYADQLLVYWANKNAEGRRASSDANENPAGSASTPESVVRSESNRGDKRKRQEIQAGSEVQISASGQSDSLQRTEATTGNQATPATSGNIGGVVAAENPVVVGAPGTGGVSESAESQNVGAVQA